MLKTLVLAGALLLAGAFIFASTAGAAASPADEIVIPLGRDVNLSNNLTVHLLQVTVSNVSHYNTYSPDIQNSVWPIVVFQYENHGQIQAACRFHVKITDNSSTVPAGWTYDKTDDTLYQPLYPNKNSTAIALEFAMPRGRVLTNLTIIDDGLKKVVANIPIVYPTPSPEPGIIWGPGASGDDSLRNLLIIPIILVAVGLVGWCIARRRL